MEIDGTALADDILRDVKKDVGRLGVPISLVVLVVGENPVTERFVALKSKKARDVGITVMRTDFSEDIAENTVLSKIGELVADTAVAGIVVQLPLPKHIDMRKVCDAIPPEKDPDMLSSASIERLAKGESPIFPPVVGAIKTILDRENISVAGLKALVVGRGMLVGAPCAIWLLREGARVSVADRSTDNLPARMKDADIVVTGAGVPGLITPDMLKDGVMLFDAGTSEENGVIKGDADPSCASQCAIFTPVPGGVGPVTVAILLKNTVTLAKLPQ